MKWIAIQLDDDNDYNSDRGICKKDGDGDGDNDDDEYNRIQDAEYYDNAGNYTYNNTDNYMDDPWRVKQKLANLAKKKKQENQENAKKSRNMIKYMHYTNLATNQSNEIHHPSFWCYFDPHRNYTRIRNVSLMLTIKKEKKTTPVTIALAKAKARLGKINSKAKCRYRL